MAEPQPEAQPLERAQQGVNITNPQSVFNLLRARCDAVQAHLLELRGKHAAAELVGPEGAAAREALWNALQAVVDAEAVIMLGLAHLTGQVAETLLALQRAEEDRRQAGRIMVPPGLNFRGGRG